MGGGGGGGEGRVLDRVGCGWVAVLGIVVVVGGVVVVGVGVVVGVVVGVPQDGCLSAIYELPASNHYLCRRNAHRISYIKLHCGVICLHRNPINLLFASLTYKLCEGGVCGCVLVLIFS